VLTSGPTTVASGPPSATFPSLAETTSNTTGSQPNFSGYCLLDYTKNA